MPLAVNRGVKPLLREATSGSGRASASRTAAQWVQTDAVAPLHSAYAAERGRSRPTL